MRKPLIDLELRSALRVDKYEPQLLWRAAHEKAVDDCAEAHRLPLARRAGNEKVRHLREVFHDFLASYVLAEKERNWYLRRTAFRPCRVILPFRRFHDLAERDRLARAVGNLYADRILSGNRSENADCLRPERPLKVALKPCDSLHAHAWRGRYGILRDDRSFNRVRELRVNAKHL